ncbi:HAD family hydrolase [Treponema sp.]|uniref:HAD family hydrolase n=1 Tax=Treponema sp. TaxID=166 RepID=UPI003F02B09C
MTVFFDLDRTLMDFETAENRGIQAVFEKYRNEISMDFDEFKIQWKKWAQYFFDEYSAGKLTFDGQRKSRIAKIFELNGSPVKSGEELDRRFTLYWTTYEAEYSLFSDALPALEKLSSLKIRMGIITNGDSENQRSKLKRAGITEFFSPIVISSEAGASKPDPTIFQKAMELSETPRDKTWYVGDSTEHDIVPARKLGINCFYLNRKRQAPLRIESEKPFYAEIKDFYEMTGIIEQKHAQNET